MDDTVKSTLACLGVMFIVFIIFIFGYTIGIDHGKQKQKMQNEMDSSSHTSFTR